MKGIRWVVVAASCVYGCGNSQDDPWDIPACPVSPRTTVPVVQGLGATSVEHSTQASMEVDVTAGDLVILGVAGTVDPVAGDVPPASPMGLEIDWQLITVSLRPGMPGSMQAPRKLWVFGGVAPHDDEGPLAVSFPSSPNVVQLAAAAVSGAHDPTALLQGDPDFVTEAHAEDFETSAVIPMGDVDPDAVVVSVLFAGENNPLGGGRQFGVEPVSMETASQVYGLEGGKERVTTIAHGTGLDTPRAQFVDHRDGAHWLGVGLEIVTGEAPPAGGDEGGDTSGDGGADEDDGGDETMGSASAGSTSGASPGAVTTATHGAPDHDGCAP